MDDYFKNGKVVIHTRNDANIAATLTGEATDGGSSAGAGPFKHYLAECSLASAESRAAVDTINVKDVAVWDVPQAQVIDGVVHTLACDDLAAAAAALAAFDVLRERALTQPVEDVRLLFTLAEEIGFIGAIAAAKGLVGKGAIVTEWCARQRTIHTSSSDADHAQRRSRHRPRELTQFSRIPHPRRAHRPRGRSHLDLLAHAHRRDREKRAEEYASSFGGSGAQPTAQQKLSEGPKWKWQRKLMAGGACEASVFCHAGYEATCVCLPLGNYHNMGDLANVQAGTNTTPAKIEREYIGLDDYEGLVDLLIACGERLPEIGLSPDRFDKLWNERNFVSAVNAGAASLALRFAFTNPTRERGSLLFALETRTAFVTHPNCAPPTPYAPPRGS
jgi:hypothetical protein